MKKIVFVLLLLIPVAAFGAERVIDKPFEVNPAAQLSLECHKGEIKIRTGAVSSIQVHAKIYPDEGPDADLELVRLDISNSSSYVRIEVDYDVKAMEMQRGSDESGILRGSNWVSLPFVDFDIVVPDGASLDLESNKSTFDVQAPAGEVTIDSHKGTGTVTRVRNDFELDTHKGEFDVEIDKMGDLEIDTHKGDVRVVIHNARDFRLRAETDSGDLDFIGYPVRIERDDDHGKYAVESVGTGEHRVNLDTHKGKIKIDFR